MPVKLCACKFVDTYLSTRENTYHNSYIDIAEDWMLVVVKKYEQNRLIKEMHEGPGGGHFRVSRIQNKLCGKYFWPTMVEDIKY